LSSNILFHHSALCDINDIYVSNYLNVLDEIPDEIVENAVKWSQFENIQSLERESFHIQERGEHKPWKNKDDINSYHVRRGKAGGYTDYLSLEDVKYLEDMSRGCYFAELSLPNRMAILG